MAGERLLNIHEITDQYSVDPLLDSFKDKGFISVDQIKSRAQLMALFHHADFIKSVVENKAVYKPLEGHSLAILFYQPSTRTFMSFDSAGRRLGADVTSVQGMDMFSSVVKGEDLPDTVRSALATTQASALVLRHPENHSSIEAQSVTEKPVINAGSGTLEHPTQALLDSYTIENTVGLSNIHVAMVGDLLYGRTVKSLSKLLAVGGENITISMVSPDELRMPEALVTELRQKGINVVETNDLESVLQTADVVYMTRVQKEWFEAQDKVAEYERLKNLFILTQDMVERMKPNAIVMHPLPRLEEIDRRVDQDPRAEYFDAMKLGHIIRCALFDAILNDEPGTLPVSRR